MSKGEEEIKDPWCDPENPRVLHFEEISAAAYRIRDGIVRTPCDVGTTWSCYPEILSIHVAFMQRSHMSEETDMQIFLKKDYMQYTGSFKERGARYTLIMLPEEQRRAGVVSASAGNHAQAMAYHGGQLSKCSAKL